MTKKELEKRVAELEKERDLWREAASNAIRAIAVPLVNPWPVPQLTPTIVPYAPWAPPFTITCDGTSNAT